jgi:hypothetical protein
MGTNGSVFSIISATSKHNFDSESDTVKDNNPNEDAASSGKYFDPNEKNHN